MKTNLINWTVTGYWPYAPILSRSFETGIVFRNITTPIRTKHLGDVYSILKAAGEIEDMYFSSNALSCEWVSQRWWIFENEFFVEDSKKDKRLRLVIEGIDYEADIQINGSLVCHHKCPFIPLVIELGDYINYGESNKLTVTVYNNEREYPQVGFTSKTSTQRSRFDYNWDFCTRLVGIGIYGPAYIEESGEAFIEEAFVKPHCLSENTWQIPADLVIDSKGEHLATLKAELIYNGKAILEKEAKLAIKNGRQKLSAPIEVNSPLFWYPNGHGEQPLYTLRLSLLLNGNASHTTETEIAFRSLAYRRADNSSEKSLPYIPVINGKDIYIKGVNLVPFDLAGKFASKEIYDKAIKMIKAANINLVRIWGGGVLESEYFYSLCDKNGIMVWQDFIQSSSGLDNSPCTNPDFLDLLRLNSTAMINQRRNHTSLTFYCGGNELYVKEDINGNPIKERPVTYENTNIALLKGLVDELDGGILMLPTTASGPNISFNDDTPHENHDIHGPWMYEGTEKHYEFFNRCDCILHGEFGCNGMADIEALKTFLPQEKLRVFPAFSDLLWNMHGGDWWDTEKRDSRIFGEFKENELEELAICSQFIQAEGIRYSLQANLRRAMQNCGSILWQFNEPWPNVACTSLTCYPLKPKLAYFFTKDSFEPVQASLKYSKLCWERKERFTAEVFAFSENELKKGTVCLEITDTSGNALLTKEWQTEAHLAKSLGEIELNIPESITDAFLVTVYWKGEGLKNRYLMLVKDESGICQRKPVLDFTKEYLNSVK